MKPPLPRTGLLGGVCHTAGRVAQGVWRRLGVTLATGAWVGLTACASGLPPLPERQPSTHLTAGADSPLAKAYTPPRGDATLNGVTLLGDPLEALASRMLLARSAQRALDVQVYIWRPDVSGQIVLHELWHAAQRGVRVRLLLDDNGSAGMELWLQALATQPGVEVRLFNPFGQRGFKALGYLTDFQRLNQRMHNKSFTADSLATIVGGRNVGDVYFGVDASLVFSDLDLMALGPAAQTTATQFDAFWNSHLAYPLAALIPEAEPTTLARHQRQLADLSDTPQAAQLKNNLQKTPWLAAYPPHQMGPGPGTVRLARQGGLCGDRNLCCGPAHLCTAQRLAWWRPAHAGPGLTLLRARRRRGPAVDRQGAPRGERAGHHQLAGRDRRNGRSRGLRPTPACPAGRRGSGV